MNPYALLVVIFSLILGTLTTISSHHWMLAWLGLEVNTLAIIPLMLKCPHPRSIEAATKYFLIQASASAMILFSCTVNAWAHGEWAIIPSTNVIPTDLLTIAIMMKLGVAPFHFWMPDVLQGLTLPTGLILSTWQKLPPVALLLQLSQSTNLGLLLATGLLSTILGGWGGINQTQIRKVLAYSSIAHLGWMVVVLKASPQLALLNFLIYILITSALFLTLTNINTKSMSEVMLSWSKNPPLTTLTLLTLLSLGGLPPLTGFLPKWMITQELIKQHLTLFASTMLLSTLLSLFFYLRLSYIMSLTLAPNLSYSTSSWPRHIKTMAAAPVTLSLLALPIYPLIS
uniref:NADH-ubiquinone oxidoreductase chain 2 n=1 Tax=Craugastor gollmeri TaxID=228440 RepID=Q53ED0_9NEOB|nr:NADH dehydrogenase subunit II [Craugastor gollmeri]